MVVSEAAGENSEVFEDAGSVLQGSTTTAAQNTSNTISPDFTVSDTKQIYVRKLFGGKSKSIMLHLRTCLAAVCVCVCVCIPDF